MKKIIALSLSIVLVLFNVILPSAAVQPETITFYYRHNKEVVVEVNENLSYEKLKLIADHIAGEVIEDEANNILLVPQCENGNHDLSYTNAKYTSHNVYSTSPKCVEKEYRIGICNRVGCKYREETLISSKRISSCHG